MAAKSTNATKMARFLAIMQIITGVVLIGFGIADRLVKGRGFYHYYDWTGYVYFGVWIGIWMCITGGLGIPGSARERTSSRNVFAGVFMGLSITSAVLGGMIITCYSVAISELRIYHSHNNDDYYYKRGFKGEKHNYRGKIAILAIMLVLGIVTFGAGIWAAICTCLMKPCCCCRQPQEDPQQMHRYRASGYVTAQMSVGGVQGAVPSQAIQGGDGGVAAQGYHQLMMQMPVSGAAGGQQVVVQATSPRVMATGTHQQQQQLEAGMPHSFIHGSYASKQNRLVYV